MAKAISLKQPFANLVCEGKKKIETRTWNTKYRGDLIICSSQNPKIEPYGKALCIVELHHTEPMKKEHEKDACCEIYPRAWAWHLRSVRPINPPIGVKGKLGIYNLVLPGIVDDDTPQIIRDIGFDFNWDNKKVWALDIPETRMDIKRLVWHFDIPFYWHNGEMFNLKPREVMENPSTHKKEYTKLLKADLEYPIDVMENKGRLVILDGLHRLMKAHIQGFKEVRVRIIPRNNISKIKR